MVKIVFFAALLIFNYFHALKKIEPIICKKPNDFWHVIAPPGTGKTTLAAMLVDKARKEKRKVYSNVPIRGAIKFEIKDLGKILFQHAKLIIDEGGSDLNNRNWQNNLSQKAMEFIKKHRHYDVDVYIFSQSPNDIDVKFRDLVTRKYLLDKIKPFVVKSLSLKKVMKLEGGQIVEYLEENAEETFKFFVPPYWAYFNSWDRKMDLEEKEGIYYTALDL